MLTRLYHHGPARQGISKGYVVLGTQAERLVQQVVREQSSLFPQRKSGITLRTSRRSPNVIWFDTGLVWLHTTQAREAVFAGLEAMVSSVALKVRQDNAVLLPNAVRLNTTDSWKSSLCEDEHRLQTSDELETATLCNLLRFHLSVLIAVSGRAGADPNGVEIIGSRRLSESTQYYAPHYLISASAQHLKRVTQCLRQDEGVPHLYFLDVYPATDNSGISSVEVNFNDGQMLLSTVRAQALLYQALLIRARRRARVEQSIPAIGQRLLQRNRARAIADGIQARFELEQEDDRKAKPHLQENKFLRANRALLEIIENLQYEFQVLETEYSELAPIVQGATLRRLGHAALQNENDLLRMFYRQCKGKSENFVPTLAGILCNQQHNGHLSKWNEQLFPDASAEVGEWWEQFLRTPASDRSSARVSAGL
jgi:hypothetical protein